MLCQAQKSIQLQAKYVRNFLRGLYGRHREISLEIIQIVMSFLFSSPFRQKNSFILKQGTLLLRLQINPQNLPLRSFILSYPHQEVITASSQILIKQGDQLILGNKNYSSQKIRISKIWTKPPTRTQKKILTYCGKFKQFMLGKHHNTKMVDQRYLKRQFQIPHHEKDLFQNHLKNIEENDANFCSYDVLDSFMTLITINYIEIEVEGCEFNDRTEKVFKVIPAGTDGELLKGVNVKFCEEGKKWMLEGQELVVWKEEKVFSRKKTLLRTNDGKVDLVEGGNLKNVAEFEFIFQEKE